LQRSAGGLKGEGQMTDAQRALHPRKIHQGERTAARRLVAEYLQRFPKDRYQTEVESWREVQSQNIEFTMKRLREPVESS
jgi:hypothetical protein